MDFLTSKTDGMDGTAGRLPVFGGDRWLPVAFLVAFTLWVLISNVLFAQLFGSEPSTVVKSLWNIPSGIVQFGLAVAMVRYEGVRLRDIGFGWRQVAPAVLTVGGFLVALNVAVAGLIFLNGGNLSVSPFALYRSAPANYSVAALIAGGVAQYLFVGPVEEIAFRGYLQNKLTAVFGRGSVRLRTAAAILTVAVAFALIHIPTLVVLEGMPLGQTAGTLVGLAISGATFGTIYALTRNLVLVAALHGIGNLWPLVVDPGLGAWPNWGLIIMLYGVVVVLYRQWAPEVG